MRWTHDEALDLLERRCALLCSKEEDLNLAVLREAPERFAPDPAVWCARSLTPLGPDGEEVHLEDCQPGRPCWQRTRRG